MSLEARIQNENQFIKLARSTDMIFLFCYFLSGHGMAV